MGLRLLYKTVVIVFALSVYAGYLDAISPFITVILHESGYTQQDWTSFYVLLSIVNVTVGFGLEALNVVASYYVGKKYVLTTASVLKFLLLLAITVIIGNTVGYLIAQAQFPQYSLMHMGLILEFLSNITSPVLWSLVGILAGNYTRERNMKKAIQPPAPPSM